MSETMSMTGLLENVKSAKEHAEMNAKRIRDTHRIGKDIRC